MVAGQQRAIARPQTERQHRGQDDYRKAREALRLERLLRRKVARIHALLQKYRDANYSPARAASQRANAA
jgi:hypothetical protein